MTQLPHAISFAVEQAARWISGADGLVVAAGAGMGVDSGLPDFRGDTGLWRAYPALSQSRLSFAEIANPLMFETDPHLAWGFYGHRLALYRRTSPHDGFEGLKRIAKQVRFGSFITTSNVDGQFQASGVAESRIYERHGSIHLWQCTIPCSQQLWPAEPAEPEIDVESCRWLGPLPRCPFCGAVARPNILMFCDRYWVPKRSDTQEGRFNSWLNRLRKPVVIEVGAGIHVPSVRRFSEVLVQARGARLIRINPGHPEIPESNSVSLPVGALEGLTLLERANRQENL